MSLNRRIRVRAIQNQTPGFRWFGLLSAITVLLLWSPALSAVQTEQTNTRKQPAEPKAVEEAEKQPAETQAEFPEWSEVESVVNDHFTADSGKKTKRRRRPSRRDQPEQLQENDLITQQDVSSLFKKIEDSGWEISQRDRKNILDHLLSESDYLVRQLRTVQGKQFMRKISKLPGGYDRIDRLRKMPHGKYRIREFIRGPDGDKMIEYMTTTKYGKNLGKLLSNAKTGRNFNAPTGMLYTQKDVLEHLQKLYQIDQAAAEQQQSEDPKSKPTKKTRRKKTVI